MSRPERLSLDELNSGAPECWMCKIGPTTRDKLPDGSDLPMRQAVQEAFFRITGHDAQATFSGWGGSFTESEQAVIENRMPTPDPDPLLSIRKSRLEYVVRDVVRDAYSGGIEFALRKPPLKHEDAEARWDLLVARALTELEQA